MGNIYKRGKVWYIDVTVKGRRVRKRVAKSKRLAELALKDAEVKAAKEEFGFAQNDISLGKFIELFMEYSRTNHRPASTDRYRAVIDNFCRFLESFPNITFISEITTELIERYKIYRKGSWTNGNGSPVKNENDITAKTRRGARAHTINFEINTLRLMFNLAIDWGYLKANPTKNVKKLKVDDSKPVRFLTKTECQRFLEATPTHLYPIYFTFINTGLRKSELENLQWVDIDFKRRKIIIWHKEGWHPKSGEREIPVNDALYNVLKDLKSERKVKDKKEYIFNVKNSGRSHNLLRNELIKIAKKADIENLTKVHTLRHTFASHLVMQGVDLPTIQKLMGHSDIETTMVYAHLAPDHLTSAVNKLQF
jgi:integrase